jgi:hypothetical protein
VDGALWCHYDLANDVLYLQLLSHRQAPTYSEETEDGYLTVRREDNDQVVGLTVVGWWKRLGSGEFPDSIHELEQAIEPWARKLAA